MISIAVTTVSGGVLDDEGAFVTGCPVLCTEATGAVGAAVVLPIVLVIVLFVMPAAQT